MTRSEAVNVAIIHDPDGNQIISRKAAVTTTALPANEIGPNKNPGLRRGFLHALKSI